MKIYIENTGVCTEFLSQSEESKTSKNCVTKSSLNIRKSSLPLCDIQVSSETNNLTQEINKNVSKLINLMKQKGRNVT
jgi:hypothetical protein